MRRDLYLTIYLIYNYIAGLATANPEIKNVVFIIIDDFRFPPETSVSLPNIEKMAANGIYFKNTFAQQALCAPSRNSILTGRRPDALRLYDFYSYWRSSAGNFTTIPQLYKDNGYETYSVGKVFHPGISSNYTDDFPLSWTYLPYHPPTEKYKEDAVCKDETSGKYQRNLVCPVRVKDQPGRSLPDLQSLEYARNILSKRRSKPFFLAIGFHKPHVPLKYPRKYLRRVPLKKVHLPKYPQMPANMPPVAWHPWTDVRRRTDIRSLNISFPYGTMPPKWTLKIRQSYYAAATYIDDLIGILMSYVNKTDTIVVLTSDHGWSLGENGLWAKYSNFDAALKVPLIFNIPGKVPKSIETPVELVDIFPTLVQLSGIKANIPKCRRIDESVLCFDGQNLVPLMDAKFPSYLNYFAISQYPRPSVYPKKTSDKPRLKKIKIMGYSIRTKRYRYTEWISFNSTLFTRNWNITYGIELYDHMNDPEEHNNVYSISKYKAIASFLSKKLRAQVSV
ncbi:iduronate 2-sulfatase [Plodia interpunctella]|uniref:iduronate 2-sulfatase n=1 Tax=Plodia interpunctella TaxID=58824 RepID=UPI002367E0A5|nr:iduronate 2-sulfatase [Plodia interpunctella]